MLGTAVKMLLEKSFGGPGFESRLCSQLQVPANVHPGKLQGMVEALGYLAGRSG